VRSRNYLFFLLNDSVAGCCTSGKSAVNGLLCIRLHLLARSSVVLLLHLRRDLYLSAQSRFKSHTTATKQQFSLVVVVAAVCTSVIQLPLNRERLWLSGVHSQSTQAKITRNVNDVFHKIWIGQNEWKLPYTDGLTFLLLFIQSSNMCQSYKMSVDLKSLRKMFTWDYTDTVVRNLMYCWRQTKKVCSCNNVLFQLLKKQLSPR